MADVITRHLKLYKTNVRFYDEKEDKVDEIHLGNFCRRYSERMLKNLLKEKRGNDARFISVKFVEVDFMAKIPTEVALGVMGAIRAETEEAAEMEIENAYKAIRTYVNKERDK